MRYCEQEYEQNGYLSVGKFKDIKEAVNLIEKQQKEIEELKYKYSDEKIRNTIIKRYREVIEKDYVSKDKIKAKIEELDDLNSPFAQRVIKGKEVYLTEMVQNILQSLLEKE